MRTFYKRALWGTLLAGGITLLGATVANAAEPPTDPDPISSLVADNGLVDSAVGDAVVEPLLGDDGDLAPMADGVASVVDDVTGTTAGTAVVGTLVGDHGALDDVVGDGALVEGGTVGTAAANVDAVLDDVAAGDVDAAVTHLGTTVQDLGADVGQTVTDAATNTDDQIIDGLVGDAVDDLAGILSGDDTTGVDDLIQHAGDNTADAIDTSGLLEDALQQTLEGGPASTPATPVDDADGLLTGLTGSWTVSSATACSIPFSATTVLRRHSPTPSATCSTGSRERPRAPASWTACSGTTPA
jgi:hypothetical protein